MSSSSRRFSIPDVTLFGAGGLKRLPSRLLRSASGVRLVTDAGLVNTDAFRAMIAVLGEEGQSRWFLYSGVHQSIENDVREAAEAFRQNACDGVIAIGGGSPWMRASRARPRETARLRSRVYDESDWSGLAPFVAIPTTAGTGSEVGRSSVITLDATQRKGVLFHPQLLAKLVILDPELTRGLPPKLTAATGADALTHCIESYTCPAFHPMCDGIALEGVRLIIDALPLAYRDGNELDARGRMLVAAAMGAVAFQKDLGVVHSMAHPLSTICGMHYGLANALCLVAGMKFCAARKPGLYRRIGIACGLDVMKGSNAEADDRTIEFVGQFLASLGLATKLGEHGVKPEQLDGLVACRR